MGDSVVLFLVEGDRFDVVKHAEEVGLNGVGVRGLSENLKEGGV